MTGLGHEQARRVAARLRDEFDGVRASLYTSDLQRAMQTAAHIGDALGVKPSPERRLREYNNGAAAGLTLGEAQARFPDAWNAPPSLDARPVPEAETMREFFERVASFIDGLRGHDEVPVLVTHGGTINILIAHWLRLEPPALETIVFSAHPTSISVLQTATDGRRIAERVNDCAHLDRATGFIPITNH